MRILVDEWAVSMGMLTGCKSIREGGMTGSQIEETVTCTRLGSSSALSFVFCWHRSKENATYCFVFTTLPQCSEDMALTLTKGTSYPDDMALYLLFTSLLWDTAGFLQFKLSLFAIAALQFLLCGFLTWCLKQSYSPVLSKKEVKESMELIVSLLNTDL